MKIGVLGIGGGGSNSVIRIWNKYVDFDGFGIEFAIANTDIASLEIAEENIKQNPKKVQKFLLGKKLLDGKGTGAEPKMGYLAALESEELLRSFIKGKEIVFISVGFGGGTGSGAAPIALKIAREEGVMPIIFGTFPWEFEGDQRRSNAYLAVNSILRQEGEGSLVYANNDYFGDEHAEDLFERADKVLEETVLSMLNVIYGQYEANSYINMKDVYNAMDDLTTSMFFFENTTGFKNQDEDNWEKHNKGVVKELFDNIIHTRGDSVRVERPGDFIISVSGSAQTLTSQNVNLILEGIREIVAQYKEGLDFKIVFGVKYDESMENNIMLSGFVTNVFFGARTWNDFVALEDVYPELGQKLGAKLMTRKELIRKAAPLTYKTIEEKLAIK